MSSVHSSLQPAADSLNAAIDEALSRIPPLWPLRHFVAVNPFVGLTDRPFVAAAELLRRVAGAAPLQSAAAYREAWRTGRISPTDLQEAADAAWTPAALVAALEEAGTDAAAAPFATVADFLDQESPPAHWSRFIIDEVSKWCAVVFDENQTTWNMPWKHDGLYAAWRAAAAHDRNPEAFGLTAFRPWVARLPPDPVAAIAACLEVLERPGDELPDFLHRQLATVAGWAGYVQYRVREDALRSRRSHMLTDLLAIRLAYDAALFRTFDADPGFKDRWRRTQAPVVDARGLAALARWQFAYEAGYQRQLARALAAQPEAPLGGRPRVQAVFCIDVRSEVLRRHLERLLPETQTVGFAGFFGFPVAHHSGAGAAPAARCPVLLVPPVETCEPLSAADEARARAARAAAGAWKAFQNSAASCFSFVESVGLGFGFALGRATAAGRRHCSRVAPAFAEVSLEARAGLAAGALRNMSLVRNHARLILICGHGSQSANNPHASGLDCGACGGHAGDVNARLAAITLNDPAVREILARQGLVLPADTVFVAGLHNTTTDDVVLFDLERLPGSHRADVARLREGLGRAGAAARRERAPSLGLAAVPDDQVEAAVRARAASIAEVRPEWGLANNAAFVAAPRSRTAGLKLAGRVFLHDYEASADAEDQVLTLILCAPVVVASWINLQYYASRIDPARYGSGNKVLHNVVGGLGVLEGNGGDLKVGLPLQSIHDGGAFTHEPRRLAVYVDAAPERIAAVLRKHPAVRQLFDHEWLHLFSLQGREFFRYRNGGWMRDEAGA
ncbi:MAG: DUF2309 domain-containing protein [Opitutaceae bacterium]|nr:DUF2309 domain-containing protein [Opitutaceae bacterium]